MIAPGSGLRGSLRKASLDVGRLTGKVVSHYRVLEVIGGGGMGLVYRAEDLKLGRSRRAEVSTGRGGQRGQGARAFRVARRKTVSALNHSNI